MRTRWSDLHVGDRIVFIGHKRLFHYTIEEIDRRGRTLYVSFELPRYKRPHYTVLHSVTKFLRNGSIMKEEGA